MNAAVQVPTSFDGWMYPKDGQWYVVLRRNAIDSSYYDVIAPDGTCPAISDGRLKEWSLAGKMRPPT